MNMQGLVKSVQQKNNFLISQPKYLKEPSHQDGSFERPKHMLQLIGKKIFVILR